MKHFRRYIVAGLLVWVPLGVTLLVLKLVADLVQGLVSIPPAYQPEQLLGFKLPYLDVVADADRRGPGAGANRADR